MYTQEQSNRHYGHHSQPMDVNNNNNHADGNNQQSSSYFLSKALGFYKLALQLVREMLSCGVNCTIDSRLIMAIINNLGHIHQQLGNLEACRKLLRDNLVGILRSMRATGEDRTVHPKDWTGLILNTMVATDTNVAAAA